MGLQRWKNAINRAPFPVEFSTYLASGFLAALGRNGYLLAATWLLAQGRNGANAVALFLLIASLTELVASPIAGLTIDRINRYRVYQTAELGRSATILMTGLSLYGPYGDAALYVSVGVFSVCDRLSLTAYQSLLPATSSTTPLMAASSFAFFMVQLGNLAAASSCGLLLSVCSVKCVLILLALCSFTSAAVANARRIKLSVGEMVISHTRGVFPRIDKELLRLTADYALLYGSGVLVSVMGAAFILRDLKGSVVDFSAMEACWSIGSIVGALLPIIAFRLIRQELMQLLLLQITALASISLLLAVSPYHLLIFMLMGASFNAGRVSIEIWLHRHLPSSEQGRAKGFLHSFAMVLAVLMFLICSTLADNVSPALVFAFYGTAIVCVSVGLHIVLITC